MCEKWRLARWPNCISTGGVAQGALLIPVSSSEVGIAGGGVEQKKMEMGRARPEADWMTLEKARECNTSQLGKSLSALSHLAHLSHTHTRTCEARHQVRNSKKD